MRCGWREPGLFGGCSTQLRSIATRLDQAHGVVRLEIASVTALTRIGDSSPASGTPPWSRLSPESNPHEICLLPAVDIEPAAGRQIVAQRNCSIGSSIAA